MRCLLPFLFACSCSGALVPWLEFDPARCVPWQDAPTTTCRIAWDWFVDNNGSNSCYFVNGVQQTCESGAWSLRLPECWAIATGAGVRVDVLDLNTIHGLRVQELARKVCDADVRLVALQRYYPEVVIPAIYASVAGGAAVVVMPFGIVNNHGDDLRLRAAMEYGQQHNVLFVCAAPNDGRNIDTRPDYPISWNMTHVLGVSAGMMDGTVAWFSAKGTNLMCFPGRNLVAQSVYYSGASSASGVAAGCAAVLMTAVPNRSASWYVTRLRRSSEENWHRVNLLDALNWKRT